MANAKTLKNEKFFAENILILAFGLVVYVLSTLYWQNGILQISITKYFSQTMIIFVLGFLHAYNIGEYVGIAYQDKHNVFRYFAYTFLYAGWYGIVLFPESGFGYIEWTLVFIMLISNFINQVWKDKKVKVPFVGQSPMVLWILGVSLFMAKCFIFYSFEGNIYDSQIRDNPTLRFIIGIIACLGVLLVLAQIVKRIKVQFSPDISDENKLKAKNLFERIGIFVREIFSKGVKALTALISGPIIIAILVGVVLSFLTVAFFTAKGIYNDIMKVVEEVLSTMTSTGENNIVPSVPYFLTQFASLIIVSFATLFINNSSKKAINENIKNQVRLAEYGTITYEPTFEKETKIELLTNKLDNLDLNSKIGLISDKSIIANYKIDS